MRISRKTSSDVASSKNFIPNLALTFGVLLDQQSSTEEYQAFIYCDILQWIVDCIESLSQHVNQQSDLEEPISESIMWDYGSDLHCLKSTEKSKFHEHA